MDWITRSFDNGHGENHIIRHPNGTEEKRRILYYKRFPDAGVDKAWKDLYEGMSFYECLSEFLSTGILTGFNQRLCTSGYQEKRQRLCHKRPYGWMTIRAISAESTSSISYTAWYSQPPSRPCLLQCARVLTVLTCRMRYGKPCIQKKIKF